MRNWTRFLIEHGDFSSITLGDSKLESSFSPIRTQLSGGPKVTIRKPDETEYQLYCYYGEHDEAFVMHNDRKVAHGAKPRRMHEDFWLQVMTWYQWKIENTLIDVQYSTRRSRLNRWCSSATFLRINGASERGILGISYLPKRGKRKGVVRSSGITESLDSVLLCIFIASMLGYD